MSILADPGLVDGFQILHGRMVNVVRIKSIPL
jgi:hypothetical protein